MRSPAVGRSRAATRWAALSSRRAPEGRVRAVDLLDAARQGVGVSGVDQEAGVAHDLGEGAASVGHDGQAHRHGLDDRHPETLVLGGHDQDVGLRPWRRPGRRR